AVRAGDRRCARRRHWNTVQLSCGRALSTDLLGRVVSELRTVRLDVRVRPPRPGADAECPVSAGNQGDAGRASAVALAIAMRARAAGIATRSAKSVNSSRTNS